DRDAIEGVLRAGGVSVEVPVTLQAGRCYRILAAAEPSLVHLGVELRSARDLSLAQSIRSDPHAVLHRRGEPCTSVQAEARVVFRAVKGHGRFAAEIWSRPAPGS